MKKLKTFAIAFILANSFWSCEKDDICPDGTPTTPSVVVEFYDIDNPTVLKNVTNLKVIALGMTEGIVFNASAQDESRYLTNGNKIRLPLRTTEDNTTYRLILNANSTNPSLVNEDTLSFTYARTDIYVSKACGFKTVFQLNADNPVLLPNDPNPWIGSAITQQSNIQNENQTHLKIYF